MAYKIAFISLGCAKNLVNTEQMMALTRAAGHTVTGDPEGADVAVLNTCGFIESAKSRGGSDGGGEAGIFRRYPPYL